MQTAKATITRADLERLTRIIENYSGRLKPVEVLEEKLAGMAIIDPEGAPADLVTMNTEIVCGTHEDSGAPLELPKQIKLVYPQEADIEQGRVSIFTPLGVALLGMRAGWSVDWKGHDGARRSLLVQSILYQPEASGEWHL